MKFNILDFFLPRETRFFYDRLALEFQRAVFQAGDAFALASLALCESGLRHFLLVP